MKKVSDAFNALPYETRNICVGVMIDTEIRVLEREKVRLKDRYYQSRKEINEKIMFMKQELERDYG
jgi:hypothetical protein